MLSAFAAQSSDPRDPAWWVWRTGCVQDPETIHASKKFPYIDPDGYYRGRFMPPCMTTPVKIYAPTRGKAIGIFKHAWSLYQDWKVGKALYG